MCTLKVRGADARLARFAQENALPLFSTLEDGKTYYRPSGRASQFRKARNVPGTYGFHTVVSDRDWADLNGQFSDALEFLARHRDVLLHLTSLNPTRAVLDFPAEVDPCERHVIIFDVTVPVELARASAEVGLAVEITLYFATETSDEKKSSDATGEPSADRDR